MSESLINGFPLSYYEIIVDKHMTINNGWKKVRKSLKEHFTWKFWEMYKEVPDIIPNPKIHIMGRKMICHPETLEVIKYHVKNIDDFYDEFGGKD